MSQIKLQLKPLQIVSISVRLDYHSVGKNEENAVYVLSLTSLPIWVRTHLVQYIVHAHNLRVMGYIKIIRYIGEGLQYYWAMPVNTR